MEARKTGRTVALGSELLRCCEYVMSSGDEGYYVCDGELVWIHSNGSYRQETRPGAFLLADGTFAIQAD
jgi:hypothetical protein